MKTISLIILIISISILSFMIGYLSSNLLEKNITGETIKESPNVYTYTKAVCNQNSCLDVLVECNNKEVISIKPVSNISRINSPKIENNESFCSQQKLKQSPPHYQNSHRYLKITEISIIVKFSEIARRAISRFYPDNYPLPKNIIALTISI